MNLNEEYRDGIKSIGDKVKMLGNADLRVINLCISPIILSPHGVRIICKSISGNIVLVLSEQ